MDITSTEMQTVYLVGDEESKTKDSWLAVTPYRDEAERLLIDIQKATMIEVVHVEEGMTDEKWEVVRGRLH